MQIERAIFTSSPQGCEKVQFMRHGHFRQDGRTVQTFAIKRTIRMLKELRSGLASDVAADVKFIGHQANLTMLQSVVKRADIKPENHYFNVTDFGNCGAAGAPTVLSQHWHSFTPGDNLVLAVVGSGLSWGSVLIHLNGETRENMC